MRGASNMALRSVARAVGLASAAVGLVLAAVVVAAAPGLAVPLVGQEPHVHSPYADHAGRDIKALSPEEVAGLLAGEGMGFALAAELNGVPGPKHALELADPLGLAPEQRRRLEEIRAAMAEAAVELGERLVELERRLDRAFAKGGATAAGIEELTARIGAVAGRLRAVHLRAHLETAAVLDDAQERRYAELRGYAPAP